MQAYRSTSSVLSSGSKLWLQQATCAESTTNARLSPSPSVIQSVSRHIHSNVGQYLPPSHLLPSHGLQQQAKSLFLGNGGYARHLSLSTCRSHSPPAGGSSPPSCQLPNPSRPYSSSVAVSSNLNSGKAHSEFQRFLRQKGVDYSETPSCLKVSLPVSILGGSQSTTWADIDNAFVPLFINKVTGNIVCPRLGLVGSWTQVQEVIETWLKNRTRAKGDEEASYPKLQKIELKLPTKVEKIWEAATPVDKLTKPQFNELLRNFRQVQRDFNQEDFSRFDARVETGSHDKLYFPVRYLGRELVGLRVVRVVGNRLEEEDLPTPGRHSSGFLPFIHNLDVVAASGAKECVVVGSVLDTVVLSTRCDTPAIVLPDMASLHPDLLPFLEQFTSVTLWLGSDVMTSDVMAIFARKIGEEVCSVVGGQHPCALAAVRKRLNVVEILDKARSCHHDYITSFEKLREEVYLEFVNSEQMEGVKWKRFQEFNGLLRGFRRGEMTILTGRTGSGKTTFLSEYSLDLCMEGVNTLWGSFEVKNVRLIKMLLKQHSLVNLDENVQEFDTVAESFQKLPMYFSTFHGASEVDSVLEAMAHAVYVHDIAHVIIDNIQFMIGSRNGSMDRFSQQDVAIERFRKFATLHNCHVTLVIHPRKDAEGEMLSVHSVYGGGKATQEADNVLLLQEEQSEDSFFKKKYIELVKNRYAGDLGIVPLAFTKPYLTMSKKVANEAKKKNMKKKSLPLVTKKKNGEIVQEAMETLIKPDKIETLVNQEERGIRKPSST